MKDEEQKKIFARNLNRYLETLNKSQKEVADAIGVSPQTFNTWCQAIALPRMGKVQKLADYFHISKSALIDAPSPRSFGQKGVTINVYGRVAAGVPFEMIEDIIDTEEITPEMASKGTHFALQIHGDSMEPKISEGDVVIVRQQDDAESGDIVIATVNGDEATCKRLMKYQEGIALISTNSAYDPMLFSNKDIMEKPVRILGKVVELRAKF